LSEEEVEYLRKRIKRIKRTGMIYYLLCFVGLVWFLIGWASDLIIGGVFLFVVSLVMGFYSTKRKNDLMKQLRKMGYKEKEKKAKSSVLFYLCFLPLYF
jgi:hypothetical protein